MLHHYTSLRTRVTAAIYCMTGEVKVNMKKMANVLVAIVLLLAGSALAQGEGKIKPIGFKCEKINSDKTECSVAQLNSDTELFKAGYTGYDNWYEFNEELYTAMAQNTAHGLFLTFKTNVDLGGYVVKNGRVECNDIFRPINYASSFDSLVVDGGGKTITGFCYEAVNKKASFFDRLNNGSRIHDITFENAYVISIVTIGSYRDNDAAIVASSAVNSKFENVTVKNSKVYALTAAGVVARSTGGLTLKNVIVDDVEVSLSEEVFPSPPTTTNLESYAGGVVAQLDGFAKITDVSVSGLKVPDVIAQLVTGFNGHFYAGGIVAAVSGTIANSGATYLLDNNTVQATLNGSVVGGLVGFVNPGSNLDHSAFQVSNSNVTLNSDDYHGVNEKRYLGGLVGWLTWNNGNVLLSKNGVNVLSKNTKEGYGAAEADLGGLVGYFYGSGTAAVNLDVEENIVESQFGTPEQNSDIGGVLGYVRISPPQSSLTLKKNDVKIGVSTSGRYLYAGGLLGYGSWSEDGCVFSADENEIGAEMNTSGVALRIGGVVGYSIFYGDNSTFSIQGSTVRPKDAGGNLINASATSLNNADVSYGVGYVQLGEGNVNVMKNDAKGDISIAATSVAKRSAVGTMVGAVNSSNTLEVKNNLSEGNLKTSIKNGTAGTSSDVFSVGYVVGNASVIDKVTITDNFHYGSVDVNADLAVGWLHFTGTDVPASDWKTGKTDEYDVRYNYRNAVKDGNKTLAAEGELSLDGSGLIVSGNDKWYDGVVAANAMKSRLFTYVMNATQAGDDNPVYWENESSAVPEISEKRTAFRLAISLVDADYQALTADDKTALKDYLPIKSCEAGACSLYVYTENGAQLKPGLKYGFDDLEAGFMVVEGTDGPFKYDQVFKKDKTVVGVTDREIEVEYTIQDLDQSKYVSVDKYADDVTFVWPKVDKIRLISGKGVVPVIQLEAKDANGDAVEYEWNFNYAETPCVDGISLDKCPPNSYASNTKTLKKMDTFEGILKYIRAGISSNYKSKIVMQYELMDQGSGYLPHIDVGVLGTKAGINMTTYAYSGKGKLKEKDTYELNRDANVQPNVDMASEYQFSLADRGFALSGWNVDFWVGLGKTSTDEIKECYGDGDTPDKCTYLEYGDPSKIYLDSESKIEAPLNAVSNNQYPPLMKWSTKLGADDKLSLDSMIYALSVVYPRKAPKTPMFLGVEPQLTANLYKISFDVNAGGKSVFLTDRFAVAESYSRENDETAKLPEGLLSTEACFGGWNKKLDDPAAVLLTKHYTSLDGDLLLRANPNDEDSFSLYGNWIPEEVKNLPCDLANTAMTLSEVDKLGAEKAYGTVTLWQEYESLGQKMAKLEHGFEAGKLEIPQSTDPMTFHVSVKPAETYALVGLSLVEYENGTEKSSRDIALDYGVDTLVRVAPASGVEYKLKALFSHYVNLAPDLNGDHGQVFYGASSNMDSILVGEVGLVQFPAWVYTVDACVWSWSLDAVSDADSEGSYHVTTDAASIYDKVKNSKTFYAMWLGADECVERAYNRVSLEAEHGAVQLEEMAQNGSASYMHSFAEDGTMILPQNVGKSEFVLRAKPEQGYKLDSLVMVLRNRDSGDEERFVLKDGEKLPSMTGKFAVSMKGFFSKKKTENNACGVKFAVCSLSNSGNAIRMYYEAKPSNESPVELQVSLMDAQGVPLVESEKLLVESSKSWEYFALVPGKYTVRTVVLGDGDPVTYDTTFVVKPEIEVEKDSWRMLSLSDVDMRDVDWKDDQLFFWWDESADYGDYFQYRKYWGGEVVATRGYWYNSLKGRSLPLRRDSATRSREIVWELDSGWTMVANPFGWAIELDEVSDNDSLSFVAWNGNSGYGLTDSLGPYEAAWVHSDKKKTVRVEKPKAKFGEVSVYAPGFDYPDAAAKKRALASRVLAKAVNRENWTLQAVLSDGRGHSDSWNVLGVGDAAEMLEPPEGMGDHVNLSVVSGKKVLAKSVVAPETGADAQGLGGYSWQVALSASSDRVGYLKFEGLADLAGFGYRVFVTYGGETREVPSGDSLRVMLKAAGATAMVHVTSNDIRTLASRLENLRFTHVPGALQVGFDVTEGLAGANVTVQLVAVNGKVAASYRAVALAGYNQFTLKAPKPGLYLLRVSLGGQHAVRKVAVSR